MSTRATVRVQPPEVKPPRPTLRNETRVAWRTGSTTVSRDKEEEVSVEGGEGAGGVILGAFEVKCGAKLRFCCYYP